MMMMVFDVCFFALRVIFPAGKGSWRSAAPHVKHVRRIYGSSLDPNLKQQKAYSYCYADHSTFVSQWPSKRATRESSGATPHSHRPEKSAVSSRMGGTERHVSPILALVFLLCFDLALYSRLAISWKRWIILYPPTRVSYVIGAPDQVNRIAWHCSSLFKPCPSCASRYLHLLNFVLVTLIEFGCLTDKCN